jgi:hypothetical protein
MRERWRAVPGWPGYEVSDLGRSARRRASSQTGAALAGYQTLNANG